MRSVTRDELLDRGAALYLLKLARSTIVSAASRRKSVLQAGLLQSQMLQHAALPDGASAIPSAPTAGAPGGEAASTQATPAAAREPDRNEDEATYLWLRVNCPKLAANSFHVGFDSDVVPSGTSAWHVQVRRGGVPLSLRGH